MPVRFSPPSLAASSPVSRANTPDLFAEFTTLAPSPPPPSPARLSALPSEAYSPARLGTWVDEAFEALERSTSATPASSSNASDYDFFYDPEQILSAPETAAASPRPPSPQPITLAAALPRAAKGKTPATKTPENTWKMNNTLVSRSTGTPLYRPETKQPYMKGDKDTPEGLMTRAVYNQQRLVNPEDGTVFLNPKTRTPYIFGDADAPSQGMRYDVYNKKRLVDPDTGAFILNPATKTPYMEGDPNAPKGAVTFIARQGIGTKRKRQEKATAARLERAGKRTTTEQQSTARKTLSTLAPKPAS